MAAKLSSTVGLLLAASFATMLHADEVHDSAFADREQDKVVRESRYSGAAALERVLIPVDEQRHIVGSKYFVSERLLEELLTSRGRGESVAFDWLIRDAALNGELTTPADRSSSGAGTWSLVLRIEVFARDTVVVLPLSSGEAEWSSSISLDGIPVPLSWDVMNGQCTFAVGEPGRYDATLTFVPRIATTGSQQRIELSVPKIDGAHVSIARPIEWADVVVEGAYKSDHEESTERFIGTLDGSGKLRIDWTAEASPSPGAIAPRAEELRWLHVDETAVVLTAKYTLEENAGNLQSLTALVDGKWKVLSPNNDAASESETPDEAHRFVQIPLSKVVAADGSHLEAMLRLQLRDAPAIGQLRLPRLELTSVTPGKYRLAVSADRDIECQVLGTGAWAPGDVQDFVTAWGDGAREEVPQLLLAEVSPRARLNVAARPRVAESKIAEILHVAATRDGLRLQYQGDVDPNESHRFQYTLDVAANTIIDDILVSRGGEPVGLRWARVSDRWVNVFFDEEIREPYRLVLVGRVPRSDDGSYSLPRATAISNEATARQLQLYRDESVLVELTPLREIEQQPELPPIAWSARWLSGHRFDDRAAQLARLSVSTNKLAIAGRSLVSLEESHGGWEAAYRCQATVERGELASLRFHIPIAWAGSYKVESTAAVDLKTEPLDDDESLLTARMAKAVIPGESIDLTIRAPLAMGPSSPIAVPDVSLAMPVAKWQSFVWVPAHVNGKLVSWSRTGVNPAELPASLRPEQTIDRIGQTFLVVDAPYHVALQAQSVGAPVAGIRLADTLVIAGEQGQVTSAHFVIAPQTLTECTLELSEGEELVELRLDGHPALARSVDARHWQLQLGPPHLPQVLEVISQTAHARPPGIPLRLRRPTLLAEDQLIPVELSLWAAAWTGTIEQADAATAGMTTALEQAALRLDRLVSIAEAALPAAAELGASDGLDWFYPWAARLTAARDQCRKLLASGASDQTAQQVSPTATDQILACESRIDQLLAQAGELWPEIEAERWSSIEIATRENFDTSALRRQGLETLHVVAAGGDDELKLELAAARSPLEKVRVFGLLAIGIAAAASIWLIRQPAACDALWRWPHAVGVLIGLAYWAWLVPSWLGLVIIGSSLLLALRSGWEGRAVS